MQSDEGQRHGVSNAMMTSEEKTCQNIWDTATEVQLQLQKLPGHLSYSSP
jgi:hypothetical protein